MFPNRPQEKINRLKLKDREQAISTVKLPAYERLLKVSSYQQFQKIFENYEFRIATNKGLLNARSYKSVKIQAKNSKRIQNTSLKYVCNIHTRKRTKQLLIINKPRRDRFEALAVKQKGDYTHSHLTPLPLLLEQNDTAVHRNSPSLADRSETSKLNLNSYENSS